MVKLLQYQREGVKRLHALKGRALLADEPGLGKTVQALQYLADKPEFRPALIVCPASLKWHWRRDAKRHFGINVEVLEGTRAGYGRLADVSVINYDLLHDWQFRLYDAKLNMVIADECQALKGREAKRTKAAQSIIEGVPKRLFLSGTPIVNRPAEFWPVLNMIDPKRWPNFHVFGHRYCGPRKRPWGWTFDGASRTAELHKILVETCMIRRRTKDVLSDLPDIRRNVVPFKLNATDRREYVSARNDLVGWLRTNYSEGASVKASKAEALAKTNVLGKLIAKLKTPYVIDWISVFLESGRKLITFAIHHETVNDLTRAFKHSAMINGTVSSGQRAAEVDKFNNDGSCDLFVGNIDAAGTGWSSTACSDTSFAELGWVPGTHLQAEKRVHGLHRGVEGVRSSAWYLVVEDTIEETKCERLQQKQKNLDKALDGQSFGEFDVFDEVIGDLLKKAA